MSAPTLRVERTYRALRDQVFAAWSDPEVLRRWWGAGPDWTSPLVEIDLRPGGRYRLSMSDPGAGAVYTVGGEFLEVVPPERLVYTWAWETAGSPTGGLTTQVRVDFTDLPDGGTTVVLTHTGFENTDQRDQHSLGWNACLDNLRDRLLPERT